MPFEIVRNDITKMCVDAIVNTANPRPVIGLGTDSMIHEAAGPELLTARQRVGCIDTGCSAITPAYRLQANYVIHTVGPVWNGGNYNEEKTLRSCYDTALNLALKHGCKSIAFPLISTGNYGFPKDKALQIAVSAFSAFLMEHEMYIYLVVFNRDAYRLSEKLFHSVASYIDQHYVDACEKAVYGVDERIRRRRGLRHKGLEELEVCENSAVLEETLPCAPVPKSKAVSLHELLKQADAGFSETLLRLIDESGHKDSTIYKRAHVSKQHFSKIRNNPNHKPTKETAIAFALALELDVVQTNDLIGRAGYTLSNSSKFDLIIRYFIERKKYDIVEINIVLYEFDQTLLGT